MRLRRQLLAMIGSYQLWFRSTEATAEGFAAGQDFAFQGELLATDSEPADSTADEVMNMSFGER